MFEAPIPETEKGTIIQVMTKGFKIGDRLLRAAQVGVSSNNVGTSEALIEDSNVEENDLAKTSEK